MQVITRNIDSKHYIFIVKLVTSMPIVVQYTFVVKKDIAM